MHRTPGPPNCNTKQETDLLLDWGWQGQIARSGRDPRRMEWGVIDYRPNLEVLHYAMK